VSSVTVAGQHRFSLALGGDLAALIFGPHITGDQVVTVPLERIGNRATQPGRIADEVETSHLYLETAEKTVVPDPVGQQVAKPRNTLRTVVIRTGDTDLTGEVEVPVNALGAIGDSIGINNTCRRMTPAKVQADLMR
jgi:hypothetical protein